MLERDRATILGTAPFQRLFSATWCPEAVPCCRSMSGSLAPSGPPASACPVRDQTPQFSRLAPGGDPCLFLNGPYFKRRKVHKGPLSWPVSRDRDQHLAIAGSSLEDVETAIAQKQKAQLQNPHQGGNLRMEQHAKRCGDANTLEMHLSTAVARHAFNFGFGLFGSWVVGLLESRFFRRGWFDARVSTAFKGRRTLPEKKARRVTNMPGRWKKTNGRASDNGAKAVLKTGQSPLKKRGKVRFKKNGAKSVENGAALRTGAANKHRVSDSDPSLKAGNAAEGASEGLPRRPIRGAFQSRPGKGCQKGTNTLRTQNAPRYPTATPASVAKRAFGPPPSTS